MAERNTQHEQGHSHQNHDEMAKRVTDRMRDLGSTNEPQAMIPGEEVALQQQVETKE